MGKLSPLRIHGVAPCAVAVPVAVGLLVLALVGPSVAVASSRPLAEPEPAAQSAREGISLDGLLQRPRIREIILSPDGAWLAALLREEIGSTIWLVSPETGERRQLCHSRRVESLWWTEDSQGLILESTTKLAFLPLDGSRPSLFFNLEATREQEFLEVDSTHPRHVLVSEKAADGVYRLLRIAVDGQTETLLERPERMRSFLLSEDGRVRFLTEAIVREDEVAQVILGFSDVASEPPVEILRCGVFDTCVPVSFDDSRGILWLRAHLEDDLFQLWSFDLASGERHSVHRDPKGLADLSHVLVDPRRDRPMQAIYDTDRRRIYGLDAETEAHLAHLREKFRDSELQVDARRGLSPWVVIERSPVLQFPRYHLYRPASRQLEPLLEDERATVAELPGHRLRTPQFVSYEASDGMRVHGWLLTPSGVDLRQAPLVARIHGGPWNHVRWRYSPVSQLLVDRGYIVFEPNFRASTGFGQSYILAAEGDFGDGRVQQDILDGVDHLLSRGIGDPQRLGILGHSFGGFSTLGGLAFTPDKFQVGVASAPPIDLVRALEDLDERLLTHGYIQKQMINTLLVGLDDPEKVRKIRRQSPENHLASTKSPLLVFAGGKDEKVDIVDVRHYVNNLVSLGKDVSFVVDPEQGHSFDKRVAMKAYYYLTERFLARHLGGRVVPETDAELEAYLATVLKVKGPSLAAALDPG